MSDFCDSIIEKLDKFNYVKQLNQFCPNFFTETKDNKEVCFPYKILKPKIQTMYTECKNKQIEVSSLQYIYEKLLNTTIDYQGIYSFVKAPLS